jgi:signal transduction histidine kinase
MEDQNSNRRRFLGMIAENAQEMQAVIKDLVELSMLEPDSRQQRNLPLADAVGEVFRQMREFGRSRSVDVRIAGELPRVEVPAAVVELCLSNYISNGIKYHDPAKNDRYVEIHAHMENETDPGKRRLVVTVRDNGLGMSELARKQLFNRFFRAHAGVIDVEGMGLGLSIVRETLASMGGEAWADFGDAGETIFAFGIPCRRASDRIPSNAPTPTVPQVSTMNGEVPANVEATVTVQVTAKVEASVEAEALATSVQQPTVDQQPLNAKQPVSPVEP